MNDRALATTGRRAMEIASPRDLLGADWESVVKETVRKLMRLAPGGSRLNAEQATDLAVYSLMNDLNPYNAEAYYMPGAGPIAGVAGYRRKANEYLRAVHGPTARFWCEFFPAEKGEGDFDPEAGDIAYRCVLHDSEAKRVWEGSMINNLIHFKKAGFDAEEALALAREIAGPEPVWVAVGKVDHRESFSGQGKPDKWDRHERAKKRAEKWAIRKAYPSTEIPDMELSGDIIDAIATEIREELPPPPKSEAQIMEELGYDADPPAPPEAEDEPGLIGEILAANLAGNRVHAENMLKLCKGEPSLEWARAYRGWRELGASSQQAADRANNGKAPE